MMLHSIKPVCIQLQSSGTKQLLTSNKDK